MWVLRKLQRYSALLIVFGLIGCSAHKAKEIVKPVPPPPPVAHKPPPKKIIKPKPLTGVALIGSLLPTTLKDRNGWAEDINKAFGALQIPVEKENICAVIAEIEQESAFQSEPVVPGLSRIVRRELEARRDKYGIPQWLLRNTLDMKSPDGRSYNERIDALKTENDMNKLYEDMISDIPFGQKMLAEYNPVKTGGPMQVSLNFASAYSATKPYPYSMNSSLRDELFTRKGGIYFGVAYLLDYPVSYESLKFRFADFNSGQYSSRNAAFQNAVAVLSGAQLMRDGDLLRYKDGVAVQEPSQTMQALLGLSAKLQMSRDDIFRDLLMEKSAAFAQSTLYRKIFALVPPSTPRAMLPEITVKSPKFTRKFTTELYAQRVEARYRNCLKREGQAGSN